MALTQECKAYLAQIFYVAMLFWGLSFSPIYASQTMTYYAFVMYKAPSAGSTWELPDMETLKPGSYRFQIVRLRQATFFVDVIALRGEFQFVADTAGGVNLSEKETLDSSQEVVTGTKLNSLWLKTPVDQTDSWEEAGRPWVQALINEMNQSGEPDANLMRFLVLKKSAKSEWQDKKNIYILYRLHYEGLQDKDYLEALSRFVNPNQAPSTEIYSLRQWIREQDHFEKAGYLGQADERHKEFYEYFQKVSQGFLDHIVKRQAQKYIVKAEEKIEEAKSSLADANKDIVKAEQGDQSYSKEQLIEFANGSLSLAENDIYAAQDELDKAKEKIGESGVADVQKRIDEVEAKIESARQQLIGLVKVPAGVQVPKTLGESIDILTIIILVGGVALFLLVLFFKKSNFQKKQKRNGSIVADYVLKKELDKILEAKYIEVLKKNQDFENLVAQIVKKQVVKILNHKSFSDLMVKKLESSLAKRLEPVSEPEQTISSIPEPVELNTSILEPIEESVELNTSIPEPIEEPVELNNELRVYLETHNLFDENLWLTLWRGDPSPCELAKRLLEKYQSLTIENYEELAAWLEKTSGDQKVYFIIPTLNQECDSNLHEIVEQRMVKGAINRVLEIKRLGLGCDEGVALKAQVVYS